MNAMETMIKARAGLLMDNPFFGSLAIRLNLIEDETAETMWTDGESIGFSPEFVEMLHIAEVKGVIAHEVLHVALNHTTRRGERDHKEWNQACDYAVNAMLKAANIDIPKGGLFDARFKDETAEKIHAELFGKKKEEDNGNSNSNKTGQNQQQQQQGGSSPHQKDGTKQEKLSGAGEVRDFKDGKATEAEKEQKEQESKIQQTQAANMAEKAGSLQGSIKEHVTAINEPKVDWKEVLNRFITQQVKNDYSFKRINTRYLGMGVMLPSLYNTTLAPVLLAVDTSGSITNADKRQFATEIEEIVSLYNVEVQVVYCDTAIRGTESFTIDNLPIKLETKGGGGTKFSPVMSYVEKMEEEPCCIIYLTDLECDDFGKEPNQEVLWIQTRGRIRRKVPFGEVVIM